MPGEQLTPSHERNEQARHELEQAGREQLEAARENLAERDPADQAEKRAEAARQVIEQQKPEPTPAAETETKAPSAQFTALLDRHLNYKQTLASVQRRLRPTSRQFSKFIHTPVVEKTSDALEATVARPSVMVGTTWTALIVGAIFYLTAQQYGYALSGSELLFSFIVGAFLGLAIEGVWRTFKRRK